MVFYLAMLRGKGGGGVLLYLVTGQGEVARPVF